FTTCSVLHMVSSHLALIFYMRHEKALALNRASDCGLFIGRRHATGTCRKFRCPSIQNWFMKMAAARPLSDLKTPTRNVLMFRERVAQCSALFATHLLSG